MDGLKFPEHKYELSLTHNEHRAVYESVEQRYDGDHWEWVSPEQREKAIATDEVWTLQWYPDSTISFYALAACDLDVLLAAALEVTNG